MFTNSASIVIATCRDSIFHVENVFYDAYDVVDEIVIVHQLLDSQDYEGFSSYRDELRKKYDKLKIIIDAGKGLSRSRNLGIKSSVSNLIFISDDDNKFIRDGVVAVREHMDSYNSDIVLARIVSPEGIPFKNYLNLKSQVNIRDSGSVSSLEMCIRKGFIDKNNITFNERFGLGTSFPSCEEFIFLSECIKASAIISRIDEYVNIHPIESSGKNLNDLRIIQAKGAAFKLVFKRLFFLVLLYFSFRKSTDLKSFIFILKNLFLGAYKL